MKAETKPEDPFNLQRFEIAQAPVFTTVLNELRDGRKAAHWMWFIFPQLRGLGESVTAQHFGISSLAEARAYLAHPQLGPRLRTCAELVLGVEGRPLEAIFGSPDDLKFHSSMTLFSLASDQTDGVFRKALERYCDGDLDERTMALLEATSECESQTACE